VVDAPLKRATVWPSALTGAAFRAHGEAEDRKLRKEPAFGGPCLEGTLQKPQSANLGFRIQSRGRDDCAIHFFQDHALKSLDAGRARELQKMRPASHTNALGSLFIAEKGRKAQAGSFGAAGMFTKLVPEFANTRLSAARAQFAEALHPVRRACCARGTDEGVRPNRPWKVRREYSYFWQNQPEVGHSAP
jgi:hypothetical protein